MSLERLAKLGIVIDTSQAKTAKNDLEGLSDSGSSATKATKALAVASVALGVALASTKLVKYADQYTTVTNRLKQATSSTRELAQAQADVSRIAQITLSDLDSTAQLYGKLGRASEELGLTQAQVARTTETITKAIKLSGASAVEADAAITQLAQGLASGVLRGEEFNSVAEQAPRLLEILKDELGATTGELRAMAAEGVLTADVIVGAFQRQSKAIDEEFKSFVPTIEAGLSSIGTGFTELTGAIDQTIGASKALTSIFSGLGGILSETAEGIRLVTSDNYKFAESEIRLSELARERFKIFQDLADAEKNSDGNDRLVSRLKVALAGYDDKIAAEIEYRDQIRVTATAEASAALDAKAAARELAEAEAAKLAQIAAEAEARQALQDSIRSQYDEYRNAREVSDQLAATRIRDAEEAASSSSGGDIADVIMNRIADGYNVYAEAVANASAVSDEFYEAEAIKAQELADTQRQAGMSLLESQLNLIGTLGDIKSDEAAMDLARLKATGTATDEQLAAAEKSAKRSFEKNKDLQTGLVGMNTAAAVMMELATNPDPFSKWLNVGTIITTGIANAAKIQSASFGGAVSSSPAPTASTSSSTSETNNNINNTFNIQGGNSQSIASQIQELFDSGAMTIKNGSVVSV